MVSWAKTREVAPKERKHKTARTGRCMAVVSCAIRTPSNGMARHRQHGERDAHHGRTRTRVSRKQSIVRRTQRPEGDLLVIPEASATTHQIETEQHDPNDTENSC